MLSGCSLWHCLQWQGLRMRRGGGGGGTAGGRGEDSSRESDELVLCAPPEPPDPEPELAAEPLADVGPRKSSSR